MTRSYALLLPLITASLWLVSAPRVCASHDGFMKVDAVTGESEEPGYEGWSRILSWSGGIIRTNATTVSTGIVVTKALDKSSPKLAMFVCGETRIPNVLLALRQDGVEMLRIRLTDVRVSSYRMDVAVPEVVPDGPLGEPLPVPVEEVTLSFDIIEMEYQALRNGEPVGEPVKGIISVGE